MAELTTAHEPQHDFRGHLSSWTASAWDGLYCSGSSQGQAVASALAVKARTSFWKKSFLRHGCLVELEKSLGNGKNPLFTRISKSNSEDPADHRAKWLSTDDGAAIGSELRVDYN